MYNTLTRYKIGLLALTVFCVVLFGYVVIAGASQRQDNQTEAKAQEIADKLNDYTLDKNQVPKSLAELKVNDIPDTISYKKLSDTSYEFCATYDRASSNDKATGLGDVVSGAALGAYGSNYGGFDDSGDSSYLVIGSHTKGRNCKTIKIYGDYKSNFPEPTGSCEYNYDKSDAENDAYYTCLENDSRTQFN